MNKKNKYINKEIENIFIEKNVCSFKPFKNTGIIIYLKEKPSIWKRFWFYLFFGWRFEDEYN